VVISQDVRVTGGELSLPRWLLSALDAINSLSQPEHRL
jgi:hypothetical protein